MASISGLAPCPECGHLNLGEVCSECGFSFKRELIFWGAPPGGLSTILRPTTPNTLGDQDRSTAESANVVGPASGTLTATASVIADVSPGTIGAIKYLIFHARGSHDEGRFTGAGVMTDVTASRFRWTVGFNSASATRNAFTFSDDPDTFQETHTAQIPTQPNGNPWTLQAVNNLTDVKVEADYTVPGGEVLSMTVDEIWIEVHG